MLRPALVAFVVTLVLTPATLAALRRWRVLDVPNPRSSHDRPVPRAGGLAPALGAMAALAVSTEVAGPARLGLVVAACAFGLLGLAEDVVGVPPLLRLALQALAAACALPWLLSGLGGAALWQVTFSVGVGVWLVAYVNAFNFMDGINGLSAAEVTVAGLAWYLIGESQEAPELAAAGLILAGAALGFAPFNFPRALVFLGDVGSYFLGGALAAAAVVGLRAGLPPEAVLAPLALSLADTGTALVRRVARRETFYLPHREHTYQRLVIRGWSHWSVTCLVAALIAACSGLGAVSLTGQLGLRLLAGCALVGLLAGYVAAPSLSPRFPRRATAG